MCASLKDGLQKVRKVYHYRFMIAGKLYKGSTRLAGYADARAFVDHLRREIVLHGHCIKEAPTLRECFELWAEAKSGVVKPDYIRRAREASVLHWGMLLDLKINLLDNERVEHMRSTYLKGFDQRRKHLPPKHRTMSGANEMLKYLKSVVGWAVDMGYLKQLPFRVKMRKPQEVARPYIPIEKVAPFLDYIQAHAPSPINTAIRMMLQMGLRSTEVRLARWEWYDPSTVTYTPSLTKGGEADPMPVPKDLFHYLESIREGRTQGYIILKPTGGTYAASFTRKWVIEAGEAVGVFHLYPHRLRATYATLLALEGTDIRTIQSLLRHKDIHTTFKYIGRDARKIRSAQDALEAAMNLEPPMPPNPSRIILLHRPASEADGKVAT